MHDEFFPAAPHEPSGDRHEPAGEPAWPMAAPAAGAASPARTNLPAALTSFVGRERELEEVARLLATARLLTLTGAGGVGKTRLALEVAGAVHDDYPDGVWLVELAALANPALVPHAIASVLDVREQVGQPLLATLMAWLRGRRLLLVLDNCEHLIEACAHLVNALLRACPDLHILATSREAVGITGDVSWRVPSLAIPPPGGVLPLERLIEHEATRLFIDRAMAALPSFALTQQNAAAVAQICQRLDGIPLALELAAARVVGLTVAQIAARLNDRFRLLTGGSRQALPRQQTLRATVDWSYDLLSEAERTLFNRLAVFAGGFTLEAAEAVCRGEGIAAADVLELLLRLVAKSLVLVEERGGEARYRLLETLRQYGLERLAGSEEAAAVQWQHAAHYLALAEERTGVEDPAWRWNRHPLQAAWYEQIEAEYDNLWTALWWLREQEEVALGLRFCVALRPFWRVRGRRGEAVLLRGRGGGGWAG